MSQSIKLPPYLPLFDPDHFYEASFYQELEKIGYTQIMLGGTGNMRMREALDAVRNHTNLSIITHPSSPSEIWPVDLLLFGAVINSNSHYTRPFGSGSVTAAIAIAKQKIPFIPVAYFIMGESTARWYADAFLINSKKIILGYCLYAKMMGYHWLLLDYEDPKIDIDVALIKQIQQCAPSHLMVTDEFTPESAVKALAAGVNTIITPSDIYEESSNPLQLARDFHESILSPGYIAAGSAMLYSH